MTNKEYREDVMGDCNNCAQDCKGSADYAAHAFMQRDEAKAREYVANLEKNLSRLKGALSSLDYINREIAKDGPAITFTFKQIAFQAQQLFDVSVCMTEEPSFREIWSRKKTPRAAP